MSRRHRRHRGTSGRSSVSSVSFRMARANFGKERFAQQLPLELLLLARCSENCRLAIYLPTPPFQGVDLVSISTSDFTYSRRYLLAEPALGDTVRDRRERLERGGLTIKSGAGMATMKNDMGGAAAVTRRHPDCLQSEESFRKATLLRNGSGPPAGTFTATRVKIFTRWCEDGSPSGKNSPFGARRDTGCGRSVAA